jgi:hypothetical protein
MADEISQEHVHMNGISSERQALIDASKAADDAYESLSDQIAAVLEAGEKVTPDLEAAHSTAMRAAVKARAALADAEDGD